MALHLLPLVAAISLTASPQRHPRTTTTTNTSTTTSAATPAKFTAITFTFKVAGRIKTTDVGDPNTFDLYDVAIMATSNPNPPINLAPMPVLDSRNPNGRVGGSPTHLI